MQKEIGQRCVVQKYLTPWGVWGVCLAAKNWGGLGGYKGHNFWRSGERGATSAAMAPPTTTPGRKAACGRKSKSKGEDDFIIFFLVKVIFF